MSINPPLPSLTQLNNHLQGSNLNLPNASVRQQIELGLYHESLDSYRTSVLNQLSIVEARVNALAPQDPFHSGVKDRVMKQIQDIRKLLRQINCYGRGGLTDSVQRETLKVKSEFGRMMVRLKLLVEANV